MTDTKGTSTARLSPSDLIGEVNNPLINVGVIIVSGFQSLASSIEYRLSLADLADARDSKK